VALIGPRQVGKTTLALEVAENRPAVYLDLESEPDRARIGSPLLYFADHTDELVVLDEIHRAPGLFEALRGAIDAGRREGRGAGRFLLLGSAALELLAQSGETLAGRIDFVELAPFDVTEVGADRLDGLWVRGGFPNSFLARSERASMRWRQSFIRTYLERDVPELGPRIPAETLRRLWTMLAHNQGGLLNAAQLARNLGVTGATIGRYVDLLVDLLLVRRLSPRLVNVGKRLVRSPKVYVRDSGLVHALLGLADKEALLGHPVVGASWATVPCPASIAPAAGPRSISSSTGPTGGCGRSRSSAPRHRRWNAACVRRWRTSSPSAASSSTREASATASAQGSRRSGSPSCAPRRPGADPPPDRAGAASYGRPAVLLANAIRQFVNEKE